MALSLYGSELLVSYGTGASTAHDYAGAAAGLANGGFALTFIAYPGYDYVTRVYDGFGASTAGPTDLGNNNINGGVSYRDGGIAELSNGALVETFAKIGLGVSDPIDVGVIRFQQNLTGSSGTVTPGPDSTSYQIGFQYNPTLASSRSGGYMVVWDDDATSYGRPLRNVIAQVFDNNGVAAGTTFVVSEPGYSGGDQVNPDVAGLANGRYVVAWQDNSGLDGSGSGVRARIFSSTGAVVSGEKAVNQGTTGSQVNPAVAGLAGGGFVVVWEDGGKIEARVFNASGAAVTGDLTIAQFAAGNKSSPDVTALLDGGFLVTWTTDATSVANGGDSSGTAVKARAFSATGAATSDEALVNSVTTGNQRHATAATLADGRVVVSWTDESNALNTGFEDRAQILDPRTKGVDVTGTAGVDKYVGSAFADILRGLAGNDQLRGGGGGDTLDGGPGADNMRGGSGNDTYVVDNGGDVVDEATGGSGVDTVRSSISFSLSDTVHVKGAVENLVLIGAAAIDATGNALANTIAGNGASNTLTGGPAGDSFLFNTALDKKLNVDLLADFDPGEGDRILLDNAIFKKLKKEGALKGKYFVEGKKAKDGNDYLVHNPKNDTLGYDKNGDKKGGFVKFAILPKGADVDHHDILVI